MRFVGREHDLTALRDQLAGVASGEGATRGRAVIVTGRRRVGKSRLVQEFCAASGVPSIVFQATRRRHPGAERADFIDVIAASGLERASLVSGMRPADWNQALRMLASVLPDDVPSIVVLDEVPWLAETDGEFEGALQTAWDRHLSQRPVLLLLIGSNQSVMEHLTDHDRPFFGRASVMRVLPLNPMDVAEATSLGAADAIDAWLITGGFPQVVGSWRAGESRTSFLSRSLADPLSPLLVGGELTLMSEFAGAGLARAVLEAVGTGERTFTAIAQAAGGGTPLASGTLSPLLVSLADAGVLTSDLPLSTASDTKNRRYRIADPYLRFWLAFGAAAVPLADRGLGRLALRQVETSWASWRGRAIEPLVREALSRLAVWEGRTDAVAVGAWWNRQNNPEVDLVGADRAPVARRIGLVGSIKWHDTAPFDRHDYDTLVRAASAVPGGDGAGPVAVSRTGVVPGLPLARVWGPDDILAAWQ